jgi:DNA-binding PadR family transcriptional regulator
MKEKKSTTPEQGAPDTPIVHALHKLIEMGLVEDSGERRDGLTCWRLSPLGEKALAQKLEH